MSYTKSQIEDFAKRLKDLPAIEKDEISKVDAIKALRVEILSMQKRGYTLDQTADELKQIGFDIKTQTLKAYLQKANPKKKLTKSEQ